VCACVVHTWVVPSLSRLREALRTQPLRRWASPPGPGRGPGRGPGPERHELPPAAPPPAPGGAQGHDPGHDPGHNQGGRGGEGAGEHELRHELKHEPSGEDSRAYMLADARLREEVPALVHAVAHRLAAESRRRHPPARPNKASAQASPGQERMDAMMDERQRVCAPGSVRVVDVRAAVERSQCGWPCLLDGVHTSVTGAVVVASALANALEPCVP
jgi:hypothetical protein